MSFFFCGVDLEHVALIECVESRCVGGVQREGSHRCLFVTNAVSALIPGVAVGRRRRRGPCCPGHYRPTLLRRPPHGRRQSGDCQSLRLEEGHHTCHPDPAHTLWRRPRGARISTVTMSTLLAEAAGGRVPPPPRTTRTASFSRGSPHDGGPRNSHALRSHSLWRRYSLPHTPTRAWG